MDWDAYADEVMSELGAWLESTDAKGESGGEILEENKKKIAKLAGGWLTTKLAGILSESGKTLSDAKIDPENFAEFLKILWKGEINSTNGQKLLQLMVDNGGDPSHIMEEHNLGQNMDEGEVKAIIERLIAENPAQVAQFKAGKENILMWFVGGVMKATEGKANPEKVKEMVRGLIG
jgi:aspartyl-tRNA(Asn)/glutamyl-tRNA(Gln) amidotransferase subunit B